MAASSETEVIAQELSALGGKVEKLEARLADLAILEGRLNEVDGVIERLESAALTTSRALNEISHHWDAVYEALRRVENTTGNQ